MVLTEWLAIGGLVLGSGAGLGLWRYSVRHEREHQKIDDRLEWGKDHFDRNDADHEAILGKLARAAKKMDSTIRNLAEVKQGVGELLVKLDLRKPGQGINGHHDDDMEVTQET
jgi:uncharacterized membrane-anchored protein YhcB (DUF1043 family)